MILAKKTYQFNEVQKGYSNQTLYINLTTKEIEIKPVSEEMKEKFIGGKGFDLFLMWNNLPKDRIIKWDDPENEICISSGPLGGSIFYPGSGKSIVTSISPLTGIIIDSNVGGYFGPYLKFSGFDALEIQGKSKEEVIIFVDGVNKVIQIEAIDNSNSYSNYSHELTQQLTDKFADDPNEKQRVSVVSTGPAAKHTKWGMLNFSWFVKGRNWASYKQAGRGGIGTVFANKNLKALVCLSPKASVSSNNPANLEEARKIGMTHTQEVIKLDPKQNEMRRVGTGHLPDLMNAADLLPTENFRYGAHKDISGKDIPFARDVWRKIYSGKEGADGCWIGCTVSCSHYSEGYC